MKKFLILLCALGLFACKKPSDTPIVEEFEIVALKTNNYASGAYFMMTGYYGTDMYYMFYTKNMNGEMSYYKIKAGRHNLYLKYSDSTKMVVDRRESNIFPKITIHIPEGSIKEEINLDLK